MAASTLLTRALPVRPCLAPGTEVYRRDDTTLQIGLEPPGCVVVADSAAVRSALASLARCAPPEGHDGEVAALIAALLEHDLLIDADQLVASTRAHPASAAPVYARGGLDAGARTASRAALGIEIRRHRHESEPTDGLLAPDVLADAIRHAGVGRLVDERPDVVVVLARLPMDHLAVAELMRTGTPHLVIAAGTHRWQVGPFVVPGETACARCIDLHRADADPRRPLVLAQTASPTVADPAQEMLALGWALRDLAACAEGEAPSTWSSTVDVAAGGLPTSQTWTPHPWCGCGWD